VAVLVDSNVLLDVATNDPIWAERCASALDLWSARESLRINPIILAEVSAGFHSIEEVDAALPSDIFLREALPFSAAFAAGKAFLAYRRRGGTRTSTLPDFFIGAHASVSRHALLTRDIARYRTYFPDVTILEP
jgi:predicted nucleic acid-binding protein